LLLGIGYLAVNPPRLYAIFGFGDVVFDPTSYATLGHIWSEDISNGAKLMQTYNQTVKIVQNGLQMYNLAMQMSQRVPNKDVWEMASFAVGNEVTRSHYNETINFNAVMNGNALNAGQAWQQSTLYSGNAGYLGSSTPANSSRMSEFATIQLLDQTSERCATILANYKSTQDANQAAENKLYSDTLDQSDPKNSMVAVLNILSGGHIHAQTQAKANGNLQACLAEQQTLEAKVQRDKLADEQIWYSDIAAARASSPALLDPTLTSNITGSYLEP
jgi:type IV secretion system protein TrbJ